MPEHIRRPKLVLLSILLLVLISYPLLTLSNKSVLAGGIPLLVVYLFAVWILVIFLAWMVSEQKMRKKDE